MSQSQNCRLQHDPRLTRPVYVKNLKQIDQDFSEKIGTEEFPI